MDRTSELEYVKNELERNKMLLLSSFGLEGIVKSENKERIFMKIIDNTHKYFNVSNGAILNMLFNTLEIMYRSDKALKSLYDPETLSKFAAEEKAYITNNLMKVG